MIKTARVVLAVVLCLSGLGAAAPERVVSLAPSETDIIEALGAGGRLVALGDGEDANRRPDLPRAGGMPPRWEILASVHPDLILADTFHRRYERDFERFRLTVAYVPATHARTLDDVVLLVEDAGRRLGLSEAATRWAAAARERRAALERRRVAGHPRIYFEYSPRPLQAVGPDSLQGWLLAQAGGDNILAEGEMPLVSSEWVVAQRPDVILHVDATDPAELRRRPGWASLPAVRNGRVFALNADDVSRAGPRCLEAWAAMIRCLAADGETRP